ncbi:MAG: lactonase family protein [Rhodospirillaceae bacterium]
MSLFAYVGCYTTPGRKGEGKGINVYRVDPRSGAFKHVQLLDGLENPSFLAVDKAGRFLYSVHGDRSDVTAYAIDGKTGHLRVIGRQPTGGYNPIHLALDATGKFLFVTNYGTDSIAVFPVKDDGTLGPYPTLTTLKGSLGPHRTEQKNIRPHHNPLDHQGRFFYVPNKGADSVMTYRIDPRRCVAVHVNEVATRPGAAPRHIDFHPNKALAYVINELDSTITTYRQDRKSGQLTPIQRVPSTPSDFTGYSTGAEIWVDRAGRNVYASNRGHDSIGVFGIDPAKGTLTPRQWVPTKGGVPRFFCFDPAQRFLYVANQGGHSILGYKVERDGKLSPTGIRVRVPSPACIVFSGAQQ